MLAGFSIFAIAMTTYLALRVRQRERELRLTIDTIPALAWHNLPSGGAEYVNKRWLDYTGLSLNKALGWDWSAACSRNSPGDRLASCPGRPG